MSASSFSAPFTCVECVQSQWVGCTPLVHGSSICPPVCGGPCPLQRRGGRRTGAVNILYHTLPAIWTTSSLPHYQQYGPHPLYHTTSNMDHILSTTLPAIWTTSFSCWHSLQYPHSQLFLHTHMHARRHRRTHTYTHTQV